MIIIDFYFSYLLSSHWINHFPIRGVYYEKKSYDDAYVGAMHYTGNMG